MDAAIYDEKSLTGFRGQGPAPARHRDRTPWSCRRWFPTPAADAAKAFFSESAGPWSKCTSPRQHDRERPTAAETVLRNLTKTDTQLRSACDSRGENERSCQRVLSVVRNIIVDVAACNHDATDQAAADVAQKDRVSH